ncbi:MULTISPECIES: sulfatase-like hydrolase/transferase [Sphingopyxis]|uniref:sulfatase-like hydrolase/transferase n=1 Tax=Sphingopyxis TaxID=165697 RepID=UPI000CDF396B|nr:MULTISPECIES: sulfatase-like hydrolase/transferase [Sphingopyxis]AVA15427.1 twin-arginine translocation pathway signal protein [Sphingopyxis sp. MG]
MWSRRNMVKAGAASVVAGMASATGFARSPRRDAPNIVFILADDLGVADLGCFGREDFQTPHLDRLAAGGIALDRAYSNSSVCSPTRLALMTGRYQYRLPGGLDEPLGVHPDLGLPPSVATLPSLLKRAGYATSLVGKWHLGGLPQYGPLRSGYDRFFGIYQGGADYFQHGMTIRGKFIHDLWEDETEIHRHGYLTDLITARSVDEMARLSQAKQPFLLSVHYTAPHWPWEGPEDEAVAKTIRDSFHYDGGSNAVYAAMVKSLDDGVGRILEAIEASGQAGNTIVVFTSDNGGERFSKVWPFRGMKGELLEGGIRVPAIFRWPGHVPAGTRSALTNITMDWVPTLLAAAGAEAPAGLGLEGRDLLPDLAAGSAGPDRLLFWRHKAQDQRAAMRGAMKYLAMSGHEFLFDVAADPREVANLRTVRPDVFDALKAEFAAWDKQMLPYLDSTFSYELRGNGHLAGY